MILMVVEKISGRNPLEFIGKIMHLHVGAIAGILIATWIVVCGISILVSTYIIGRKEY